MRTLWRKLDDPEWTMLVSFRLMLALVVTAATVTTVGWIAMGMPETRCNPAEPDFACIAKDIGGEWGDAGSRRFGRDDGPYFER
jgi:hypothetical protein